MRYSNIHYIVISHEISEQRLDNFLYTYLKKVPKNLIYRIIRTGEVRVNAKRVRAKYKIKKDDQIRIPPMWISNTKLKYANLACNNTMTLHNSILYEDDYLLILNKPSGIAVHSGSGIQIGIIENLRFLRPNENFLELVHRLDKHTSGTLIIAKKRSTLRALNQQLYDKKIKKEYLALVQGQWNPAIKKIILPLTKKIKTHNQHTVIVDHQGKVSETHFKIEKKFTLATLIRASLITGRTHQIRVHAQYIGHPIACDERYGNIEFNKKIKNSGLNRLFLHATTVQFIHPNTGKVLNIVAPLDKLLNKCLEYLHTYHEDIVN